MRVKVLVIPVFRRHWAYHAWVEQPLDGAATDALLAAPWWKAPGSLQDKVSALTLQMHTKMSRFVADQWAANAASKEGSFRNWLHRLALTVMSHEDPVETFLKQLPRSQTIKQEGDLFALEVLFPSSLDPVLVRRRLWHIAARRQKTHKRVLLGWTVAAIPQLPLVLTPLPNVTLYYALYRAISHYQAWGGAATLLEAMDNPASRVLQRTLNALLLESGEVDACALATSHSGHSRRSKGQQQRLGELQVDRRLEALLQQLGLYQGLRQHSPGSCKGTPTAPSSSSGALGDKGGGGRRASRERHQLLRAGLPVALLMRSQALEDAVRTLERWRTPLDDSALASIGKVAWMGDVSQVAPPQQQLAPEQLAALGEHVARTRRRALEHEARRDAQRGRAPPTPPANSAPTSSALGHPAAAQQLPAASRSAACVARGRSGGAADKEPQGGARAVVPASLAAAAVWGASAGGASTSLGLAQPGAPQVTLTPGGAHPCFSSFSSSWAGNMLAFLGAAGGVSTSDVSKGGAAVPSLRGLCTAASSSASLLAAEAAGQATVVVRPTATSAHPTPNLLGSLHLLSSLQARVNDAQLALRRSMLSMVWTGTQPGAALVPGPAPGVASGQHMALACLAAGAWAMLAAPAPPRQQVGSRRRPEEVFKAWRAACASQHVRGGSAQAPWPSHAPRAWVGERAGMRRKVPQRATSSSSD